MMGRVVGEGYAGGVSDSSACVDTGKGAKGEEGDAVGDIIRGLLWGEGNDKFPTGTQCDYEVSGRC